MIQRFEDFVTGIAVCYKSIQRIKTLEMTEFGLKGAHMMCLFFLHRNPKGRTAAHLCQLCAEDKAAISRTLATLQERGYIVSGGKKYRAMLRLTPDGAAVADRFDALICQWVGLGGDGLSEEERAVFYRALGHIADNLRGSMEKNASHNTI